MSSLTSSTSAFAEAKTVVVWDMEDCPIPDGLNPGSIKQNIKSALEKKDYRGEVIIRAYGDKNQIPGYFNNATIRLVAAGDRHARVRRMKSDVDALINSDRGRQPLNIMVISRDKMDFASSLRDWKETNYYNLLVAQPEDAPSKCYNSRLVGALITEEWFWASLSAGGEPIANRPELSAVYKS